MCIVEFLLWTLTQQNRSDVHIQSLFGSDPHLQAWRVEAASRLLLPRQETRPRLDEGLPAWNTHGDDGDATHSDNENSVILLFFLNLYYLTAVTVNNISAAPHAGVEHQCNCKVGGFSSTLMSKLLKQCSFWKSQMTTGCSIYDPPGTILHFTGSQFWSPHNEFHKEACSCFRGHIQNPPRTLGGFTVCIQSIKWIKIFWSLFEEPHESNRSEFY